MRKALSWIVVSLGLMFGLLGFALLTNGRVPEEPQEWNEAVTIGISVTVFVVFLIAGSLVARRNPKRAAWMLLIPAVLHGLLLALGQHPSHSILAIMPLGLAAFWFATSRLGWPALTTGSPPSFKRRAWQCLALIPLYFIATFALTAWHASLYSGTCRPRLHLQPAPEEVTFTARILFSGIYEASENVLKGAWAIAAVDEQFLQSNLGLPRVVMLLNNAFRNGQSYLVQGYRRNYILPRAITIVDAEPCTITNHIDRATTDLYILRNLPQAAPGDLRIFGTVRNTTGGTQAGVKVRIQAAATDPLIVTTDAAGFFEAKGLEAHDYTVQALDPPPGQRYRFWNVPKDVLLNARFQEVNPYAEWLPAGGATP